MRCHGVFPAKDLAGVGRLLLDGCGIRSAGGRAALKNLNTVSFLMKRFNKIYLIDSMTQVPKWKTATSQSSGEQGPFLHGTAPADTAAGPSPGFMLAATAENV
jgi:hypothetical protein